MKVLSQAPQRRENFISKQVKLGELISLIEADDQRVRSSVDKLLKPGAADLWRAGADSMNMSQLLEVSSIVAFNKFAHAPLGCSYVMVDIQRNVDSTSEGPWIFALVRRELLQLRPPVSESRWSRGEEQPALAVAKHAPEGAHFARRQPDRHARTAPGTQTETCTLKFEVATGEVDARLGPEALHHLKAFFENADTLPERNPYGFELELVCGTPCGSPESKDETAAGDEVKVRDLVREDDGVAQGGQEHRRAKPNSVRACSDGGERREGLETRPRQNAVADPGSVTARRFRGNSKVNNFAKTRVLTAHYHLSSRKQNPNRKSFGVNRVRGPFLPLHHRLEASRFRCEIARFAAVWLLDITSLRALEKDVS
jgi:hypothetical protein